MGEHSALEQEVAELIVEQLNLEEVDAREIDPAAPLFGDGLGLDSIDALEMALAVSRRYGVELRAGSADNVRIFSSLRALCEYIASKRSG